MKALRSLLLSPFYRWWQLRHGEVKRFAKLSQSHPGEPGFPSRQLGSRRCHACIFHLWSRVVTSGGNGGQGGKRWWLKRKQNTNRKAFLQVIFSPSFIHRRGNSSCFLLGNTVPECEDILYKPNLATSSSCSELENTAWLTQTDSDEHILADTSPKFGLFISLIFFFRQNLFVMPFLFTKWKCFLSQMTLCDRQPRSRRQVV